MNRRSCIGLSIAVVTTATLAGCGPGGGTSSSDDAAASSLRARLSHAAAALTATVGSEPRGKPTGTIRVVNLVSANGQPAGPVDLYDVFRPTRSDVPIIKDLAYGQVSDYVSPRAGGPGNPSQLFVYPAGSLQPSGAYTGSNLTQAGWTADQKVTVVLMPGTDPSSFGSKDISDAPSSSDPASTTTAPAGDVTVVTWNADSDLSGQPDDYLSVDGTCLSALGRSADLAGPVGGIFAVPAGTHTLGVFAGVAGSGMTMQQCATAAATPADTESLTASSGGRVDVISYGGGAGALKVLVAPVE